jgi:hypothetical protein
MRACEAGVTFGRERTIVRPTRERMPFIPLHPPGGS